MNCIELTLEKISPRVPDVMGEKDKKRKKKTTGAVAAATTDTAS